MRRVAFLVLALAAMAPLGACVAYVPAGPVARGGVWVPGHYGPAGFWIRGHWA